MKKKLFVLLMSCVLVFALTACGGDTETEGEDTGLTAEDIKVGFVYIGSVDDEGWTNSHDDARIELEETLGVETMYLENVAENADCEKAIRDLIDQGCNVIFTTSFGFGDWTETVAADYPDIYFFHASGYKSAENFVNYFGRIYQARYLSGIAAGLKTESNQIGYVAAMPIAEVIRGINAFTLGVRSVNPDATVEVVWTGVWGDAALEKAAAQELLNKGCDVLTQHQDTPATQLAAEEDGAFCVGYHYPTPDVAPAAYLTAPVWNWAPYYIEQVQAIIDGTWTAENYWGSEVVKLDTLTDLNAEGAQAAIDEAQAKLDSGEWDVFAGPINDQDGNVKIAEGVTMTDEELLSFDWFVEGVIGTISN